MDAPTAPSASVPVAAAASSPAAIRRPSGLLVDGLLSVLSPTHALTMQRERLEEKVLGLETESKALREALARTQLELKLVAGAHGLAKCGPLHKYLPETGIYLFRTAWTPRFFSLCGASLLHYASEKDAAAPPAGRLDLSPLPDGRPGVTLSREGPKKRGRYWAFSLADAAGGGTLLRLSADSEIEAESWLAALAAAGCQAPPKPEPPSTSTEALPALGGVMGSDGLRRRRPTEGAGSDPAGGATSAESARRARWMRPSAPVHTECRPSLLSSEAFFSQQHSGLVNLGVVVLAATHVRLVLENILKHGWLGGRMWGALLAGSLASPAVSLSSPVALLLLTSPLLLASPFVIERLAAVGTMPGRWAARLQALVASAALAGPFWALHTTDCGFVLGLALAMTALIAWMKVVSFMLTAADLRAIAAQAKPGENKPAGAAGAVTAVLRPWAPLAGVPGADHLTLGHYCYFLAAPTLCYQASYPRSGRIRRRWLLRRLAELLFYTSLFGFIVEQYMSVTIQGSVAPFDAMDPPRILERTLKLALPVLYAWLAGSYGLFHVWLNILAEVLRFGDREFYRDWWNATTIEQYWRTWNVPVHAWLLRHVYYPALRHNVTKLWAMVLTFFVSAVLHELCVGAPLHLIRLWAFAGIFLQLPLIGFTNALVKYYKTERLGNVVFWVLFVIIGQPILFLTYYHDYVVLHRPSPVAPAPPAPRLGGWAGLWVGGK